MGVQATAPASVGGSARTPRPRLSMLLERDNAFGFVRLALALLVIVSHSYSLGGFGLEPLMKFSDDQTSLGLLAVFGFFAISGFLVTASARSNDLLQYTWKRVLRIIPAYWFVLILTMLVIAPFVYVAGTSSLSGYWGLDPSPWGYFWHNANLNIGQWGIGDLLIKTPYGKVTDASVFNGSIWTLIYEARCYLVIGVLSLVGVLTTKARVLVPLIAVGLGVLCIQTVTWPTDWAIDLGFMKDEWTVRFGLIFALGASMVLFAKWIPVTAWLAVPAAVLAGATLHYGHFYPYGCLGLTYFILWLCAVLPGKFRVIGRAHDISYGVYLYGFPVQQVLAEFNVQRFGVVPYTLLAAFISCLFGALSWILMESPALSLKSRGPGHGFGFFLSKLHRGNKVEPT